MYDFYGKLAFNNKENECTKTTDGRTVWLSRSCAVVGIIAVDNKVLMVKRGLGCPDEVGKWVLPCGYLDYDETLQDAIIREVYEETGFNLVAINTWLLLEGNQQHQLAPQPFFTRSEPRADGKQNVSHYFRVIGTTSGWNTGLLALPAPSPDKIGTDECEDVAWLHLSDIELLNSEGKIGFKHYEVLRNNFK